MTNKVKIGIGPAPETVTHEITIVLPGGDEADLSIDYIYRSKDEFAEFLENNGETVDKEYQANLTAAIKHAGIVKATFDAMTEDDQQKVLFDYRVEKNKKKGAKKITQEQTKSDAEQVLQIAKGWDLGDEFTLDNLIKFENRYSGVLMAIVQGYPQALFGARLKN